MLYAPCGDCSACCNEVVAKRVSLRAKELSVRTVCKTKDNVFVTVEVVVIYRVPDSEAAYDAAYKLTSIKEQLGDYVEDVLRSHIASFSLDEVFLVSKQLADTVEARTEERFRSYGYELDATLVTGIEPDARVKESMNQINASRRTKEAQVHLAEANKAIDVKRAEARAEVVYLQGVGVARMREAIMQGMKETIEDLDDASQSSTNPTDILLTLQHMEALEKIAEAQKAKKNSNNAGPAAQQPLFLPIGVDSIGAVRRRLHAFLSNVVDKSTSPPQGYFSLV